MLKIGGFRISNNKPIGYSLTEIYGLGIRKTKYLLNQLRINSDKIVNQLTVLEKKTISDYLDNNSKFLGLNLKNLIAKNIEKLINLRCYRGIRHAKNLPVRGQRTRTNSRTVRPYKKIKRRKNKIRYVTPKVNSKDFDPRTIKYKRKNKKN